MKTTTIIVSQSPLRTLRVAEALRMGVGLTLCDDSVQVLFIGDGVFTLLQTDPAHVGMPEYARHIETIKQLGHRLYADLESLKDRNLDKIAYEPELVSKKEAIRILLASDFVIRY